MLLMEKKGMPPPQVKVLKKKLKFWLKSFVNAKTTWPAA